MGSGRFCLFCQTRRLGQESFIRSAGKSDRRRLRGVCASQTEHIQRWSTSYSVTQGCPTCFSLSELRDKLKCVGHFHRNEILGERKWQRKKKILSNRSRCRHRTATSTTSDRH